MATITRETPVTIGVTSLAEIAAAKGDGWRVFIDATGREHLLAPDCTVVETREPMHVPAGEAIVAIGRPKLKSATVWMRALRPHTYMGHPHDVGDVYLAHPEQVENIINLKFAVRDTPPKRATR